MRADKWIDKNTESLNGRRVAISGATGGLGNALCRHFAALGASLILLDRNRVKSQALADALEAEFPSLAVERIPLDLEDVNSVLAASEMLLSREIDYLVLNAGAYHIPRRKCETGLDNVFQINFASPYYLARRLAPNIQARGGRIVAVGSIAHRYSESDPEDIDFSTRSKSSLVYGNAKRYLMFALYRLFEGENCLAVAHPGITFTNITAHYPKLIFAIIKHPMKVIFMKTKKASLPIVKGLFTPTAEGEWIGPRFFDIWGVPKSSVLRSYSRKESDVIFSVAEKIYEKMAENI